ncbi:hypothetical protein BGZ75_008063 [Mortierella antarctica]|nr:hypothetical protein BGZ75_008063 [Mortierella antarctica]
MVNYYKYLDEQTSYAPCDREPCREISVNAMNADMNENGDQVLAAAPIVAPSGRTDEAFPKKWYLTGKDQQVLTSRVKHDPYHLVDLTNVPIVHTGAEPTLYWINIFVMVSTDALTKLKGYAKKKPSANNPNHLKSLADLQAIEVEVNVGINNGMVTKVQIALRAHQQIKLDKDQKLQLVLKPMTQIKQAGGLRILWVEMVNLQTASNPKPYISMTAAQVLHCPVQSSATEFKSTSTASSKGDDVVVGPTVDPNPGRWYLTLKNKEVTAAQIKSDPYVVDKRFKDLFTLSKRQAFGADSTVLLLLHRPIELDIGARLTLEFTVGAQINQAGGFKLHNIDLVSCHLKGKAVGLKDNTLVERDEDSHLKFGGQKKSPAVEQKSFGNSQACDTARGSSCGAAGSSFNSAANKASSCTVINGLSPLATSATSGTASTTFNSLNSVVDNAIHKSSDSAACSSSSAVPNSSSTANNEPNSTPNNTTVNESTASAVEPSPAAHADRKCKEVSQSSPDVIEIAAYTIDKSGTKLATLSYGKQSFYLDVWDIEHAMHNAGKNGKKTKIDTASGRAPHLPSSSTKPAASLESAIGAQLYWNHHKSMTVAVSFGASQVALIPHSVLEPKPRPFLLFECNLARKTFVEEDSHEDLKWFVGYGDFCCPLQDDGQPDAAHEKFLACDGYSVTVYRCPADRAWTLLWNISLAEAPPRPPTPCVDQGKYRQSQNSADPWHCAGAYTVCKSLLPKPSPTIEGLILAEKLVQSVRHRYFAWTGFARAITIWDFETGSTVSYIPHPKERKFSDICTYLSVDGSVTVVWYKGHGVVGTYWTASGIRIKLYTDRAGIFGGQFLVSEKVSSSGQIELEKTTSHLVSLLDGSKRHLAKSLHDLQGVITISATGSQSLMCLQGTLVTVIGLDTAFAQISNDWDCKPACSAPVAPKLSAKRIYRAVSESVPGVIFNFHRTSGTRFVVERTLVSGSALYTLKLVSKEDAKETTLLVFSHKFKYAMLAGDAEHLILVDERYVQIWMIPKDCWGFCRLLLAWCVHEVAGCDGFWSEPFSPRLCCHGRTLTMDMKKIGQSMTINLSDPKVFKEKTTGRFLGGMQLLLEMYTSIREINKQTPGNPRDCLTLALSKYLGGYINHNPTPHEPLNTVLAQICHRWTYDAREIYKDILLRILYPTKCWSPAPYYRSYKDRDGNVVSSNPINILLMRDNACVINTARLLYIYCLQRAHDTGQIGYLAPVFDSLPALFLQHRDHASRYFRDMALIKAAEASFLREAYPIVAHTAEGHWYHQQIEDAPAHPNQPADLDNTDDKGNRGASEVYVASYDMLWEYIDHEAQEDEVSTLSWLVGALAHGLGPFGRTFIKRHEFCLRFLDNPAIEALIGQKCLGYNIVGLLAFSMPLAGSVNQIWIALGGNVLNAAYLFSLSPVVFSLHLLFELRVFKSVYKFVSMLVAVVSGLKTVLLVLALSIIVFGTAILHAIGLSSTATVAVPRTLYFLILLFVYFAVIMILYILLDLMNAKYQMAEVEWLLNWNDHRLCYVERAENWTVIFPGFRKDHGTPYSRHVFFSPAPSELQAFKTRHPKGALFARNT